MKASEVAKLFILMQDYYPRDASLFAEKEVMVRRAKSWAEVLADVSFEDGEYAVREQAKAYNFAPTIAEIREYHDIRERERREKKKREELAKQPQTLSPEAEQMKKRIWDTAQTLIKEKRENSGKEGAKANG